MKNPKGKKLCLHPSVTHGTIMDSVSDSVDPWKVRPLEGKDREYE